MAYIKVDHSQFEKAASAVETYVAKHKSDMSSIGSEVEALQGRWQGADYQQVKKEWQQMAASDSTSGKMLRALENYADFLRYSAKKYKDAQANAINRANNLPRW